MDLSSNPNKRPRPDTEATEATPPKPGKGKGKGKPGKGKGKQRQVTWTGWGMHAPAVDETVQALARLCLRQEEEISELRQEKGFVMHLSTGKFGLVRALLQSSMEWHRQRDLGTVDCNLRTCLFRLTLAELKGRLTKLQDTPPSLTEAIKAKWATDNPLVWLYQTWCPEKSCLQLNEAVKGVSQDELLKTLSAMDTALQTDPTALCQFKALRPLSEEMRGETVAFKISIALRGLPAQVLHNGFTLLDSCAALQLIGGNLHRERQRPSREANVVREYVYGKSTSGYG